MYIICVSMYIIRDSIYIVYVVIGYILHLTECNRLATQLLVEYTDNFHYSYSKVHHFINLLFNILLLSLFNSKILVYFLLTVISYVCMAIAYCIIIALSLWL